MNRKYIIVADDSIKGFDEEIAKLEREWGAEEIEPSEDCISRAAALRHRHIIYDDDGIGYCVVRVDEIIDLPPVTPQRPKGKWIEGFCSECGKPCLCAGWGIAIESKYCPNCGAEMSGGGEE